MHQLVHHARRCSTHLQTIRGPLCPDTSVYMHVEFMYAHTHKLTFVHMYRCIAPAQEIMRLRFIIQGGVYDLYHNHYDVQVGFLTKVPIDFKRDGTDRYGGNSGGKRRGCEASISSLSQTSKQLLPRRRGYHNLFRLVHPRSGVFILNHQNKPKPPKKKSRLRCAFTHYKHKQPYISTPLSACIV